MSLRSVEAPGNVRALFSEIYQVTGPVERFAGQIASQGYVVGATILIITAQLHLDNVLSSACPSVYHEFEGPEPIPYDTEGDLIFCVLVHYRIKITSFRNR